MNEDAVREVDRPWEKLDYQRRFFSFGGPDDAQDMLDIVPEAESSVTVSFNRVFALDIHYCSQHPITSVSCFT